MKIPFVKRQIANSPIAGFTLIELLTTLIVLSILVVASLPSLSHILHQHRADKTIQQLLRLYNIARTTAVNNRRNVYFCGSNSGNSCDQRWSQYFIIFIDKDNNKKPSSSEILYIDNIHLEHDYIITRIALARKYAILSNRGNAKYTGSMIYCSKSKDTNLYRRLTWNHAGRAYIGTDKDKDGIVDDTNGKAISCN